MIKEYAFKWIKALRSGKFKQGKNALCTVEGKTAKYCCLGVLCHILKTPYTKNEGGFKEYEGNDGSLPKSIMKKCNIDDDFGCYFGGVESLAALNDNGKSFKQIADVIEQNWKQL